MSLDNEVSWKSPTLNKGRYTQKTLAIGLVLCVEHVDRIIDPYLATVLRTPLGTVTTTRMTDIYAYTGLHATLADARSKCEEIGRQEETKQ